MSTSPPAMGASRRGCGRGLTRVRLDSWLAYWSANYAFLRRAVDAAGRSLAKRPYESFLEPGEELSFSEVVDGIEVHFAVDLFRVEPDGTLWVFVDADAGLPTPLRIRPSVVFRKLRDGTAFLL